MRAYGPAGTGRFDSLGSARGWRASPLMRSAGSDCPASKTKSMEVSMIASSVVVATADALIRRRGLVPVGIS